MWPGFVARATLFIVRGSWRGASQHTGDGSFMPLPTPYDAEDEDGDND